MTYASCGACGWRGVTHNFDAHVCCRRNAYQANRMDLQSGWPPDHVSFEKLGSRALDAINPDLAPRPYRTYTWDELLPVSPSSSDAGDK